MSDPSTGLESDAGEVLLGIVLFGVLFYVLFYPLIERLQLLAALLKMMNWVHEWLKSL